MQEEIQRKSVALSINGGKLTAKLLGQAMLAALRKMRQVKNTPGKLSLKQLARGGALSSTEITDKNIKSFDPVARKYGITYALKKDEESEPPRWVVFFRAKDTDALTAAFKEFSAKTVKLEKERPSVRETMKKFREAAQNVVKNRTKHKNREGPER